MNIDRRPLTFGSPPSEDGYSRRVDSCQAYANQEVVIPGVSLEIEDGQVTAISFENQPIVLATLI
jgi:hypothetical protein